jgi:hypothetical protein
MSLLTQVDPNFWFAVREYQELRDFVALLDVTDYTLHSTRVLPAKIAKSGNFADMDVQIVLAHKNGLGGLVFEFPCLLEGSLFPEDAKYGVDMWFSLAENTTNVTWVKDLALSKIDVLNLAFSSSQNAGRKAKRQGDNNSMYQVLAHPNKPTLETMVVTFEVPPIIGPKNNMIEWGNTSFSLE